MTMNLSSAWKRMRARSDADPYFAEFVLAATLTGPYPDSAPGLRMAHTVTAGEDHRLATWWVSRDAYEREAPLFRHTLGLPEASFAGFPHQIHEPKESWWKRLQWKTALLGLVAVLGALEALRHHYDWLFEGPALRVQAERRPWRYVAGNTIEENITLTNDTAVDHRDVSIRIVPRGAVTEATIETQTVKRIRPGASITLPLTGKAPGPGTGAIRIEVTARAGLTAEPTPQLFEIPVRIWPAQPMVSTAVPKVEPRRVIVDGQVRLGYAAPTGLSCTVDVVGDYPIADVHLVMDEAIDVGNWQPGSPGSQRAGGMAWTTRPIDAFRSPSFSLRILTTGPAQWPAGFASVHCTDAIKKEK